MYLSVCDSVFDYLVIVSLDDVQWYKSLSNQILTMIIPLSHFMLLYQAREYSSLLSDLWFEEKSAVSPVSFKRLLGKLNSDYAGLQQQDAHEVS